MPSVSSYPPGCPNTGCSSRHRRICPLCFPFGQYAPRTAEYPPRQNPPAGAFPVCREDGCQARSCCD